MPDRASAAATIEARLGYKFRDPTLLETALTHSSVGDGGTRVRHNERLEFLGDRVLGLLGVEHLLARYPTSREGELSRALQRVVSREVCAEVARQIDLGAALRLSPAETRTGGRTKDTVLGNASEALLGAVYQDGGLDPARAVFAALWSHALAQLDAPGIKDTKSALQEWAAAEHRTAPSYRVVDRSGPDHAPRFLVEVAVGSLEPATGEGGSRQSAEKAAATALLAREKPL